MRVHINTISSISHMTYHDGVPCDKYTATVCVTMVGGLPGRRHWYLRVYASTATKLNKKLDVYRTNEIVDIPTDDLYDKTGVRYGETRNTLS